MTRAEFVAAVNVGLRAAPGLPQEHRNALLRLARTAKSTVAGSFTRGDCGCPLTDAGVVPRDHEGDMPEGSWEFIKAFDRFMATLGYAVRVVQITD